MEKIPKSKSLFGGTIEDIKDVKPKKKKSQLFEQIRMMFEEPEKFSAQSNYEKGKHFFMMNRFFSIKFPIQAQMFNSTKINPGEAVQIWCDMLRNIYSTTPSFIWYALKHTKKTKTMAKDVKIDQRVLEFYANKFALSQKQIEETIDYVGEDFINELKKIEKEII